MGTIPWKNYFVCNKQGVQILAMDDNYVPYGKSTRYARNQTNDDHFR